MTVKQLFEKFSQPMQTVTISELIHPSISATPIYDGKVRDIPSNILGMKVFSWSGSTKWYGSVGGYDTDIFMTVEDSGYTESFKSLSSRKLHINEQDKNESIKHGNRKFAKIKEARIGRTKSVYVSQEYVPGYGWEDVTIYDDMSPESERLARQDVKDYRDNGYDARMITRKLNNPDYVEPTNSITKEAVLDWIDNECPYNVRKDKGWLGTDLYVLDYRVSISVDDDSCRITDIGEKRTYTVHSLDEMIKKIERIYKKWDDLYRKYGNSQI